MFAFLYGAVKLIGCSIYKYNSESIRLKAKQEALDSGLDFYFDGDGAMWYCGNGKDERCRELFNHNVFTGKHDSNNGHHVLISFNTGRVLKDYTLEKEREEERIFKEKYNNAYNKAKECGKKYFLVCGIGSTDYRCGHYEIDTGRLYILRKIMYYDKKYFLKPCYKYYKRYFDGRTKKHIGEAIDSEISKEEYDKLGGDPVMSCYSERIVGNSYCQRNYY